jgi:MYND finger
MSARKSCAVCGVQQSVKRCLGCHCVFYCGVEHQKQGRRDHKEFFKAVQRARASGSVSALQPGSEPVDSMSNNAASSRRTLLIVGDVGYFATSDDWLIDRLRPALKALPADVLVVPFDCGGVGSLLQSGRISAMVVSALISNERASLSMIFCENKQRLSGLLSWVQAGGQLIFMAGEGQPLLRMLRTTFGKPWSHDGDFYRRTIHHLSAAAAAPAPAAANV